MRQRDALLSEVPARSSALAPSRRVAIHQLPIRGVTKA